MSLFQGKVYLRARELKRVPKDFDWPLGQVWRGYLTRIKTEPPLGEGYQLWETTTKGSPKSPVFDTLEELCEWCETNATAYAKVRFSAEQWKELLTNPKARLEI